MRIVLRITNRNKKNFAKCLDVNKIIRILNQVKKQKHKNKGNEMTNQTTNETENKYPIELFNKQGDRIYYEDDNGIWCKMEYDLQGNRTYFERKYGYWAKYDYDVQGNQTYYENSDGLKIGTPKNTH